MSRRGIFLALALALVVYFCGCMLGSVFNRVELILFHCVPYGDYSVCQFPENPLAWLFG
jgi:hypothetical protein